MTMTQNERLREARLAAGYKSAAKAAEAFGWNISTYRHHENGTRGFGKDHAKAYGGVFGVSAGWLLGLETNAEPDAFEKILTLIDTPDEFTGGAKDLNDAMMEEIGYTLVPHYHVSDFDQQLTYLPIQRHVEQEFKYSAHQKELVSELAYVSDKLICSVDATDSLMAPVIKLGDRLLVDTGSRELSEQDAIWLLAIGGTCMIRRLLSLPNDRVSIYADGLNRSTEVDRSDIAIRGKIVWIGQRA